MAHLVVSDFVCNHQMLCDGTVAATDPDFNSSLTDSITAGNTGGAVAIDAATGEFTFANAAALNFETVPSFSPTVRTTDNGTPALSASATVTVNTTNVNEAPVVPSQMFGIVVESPAGRVDRAIRTVRSRSARRPAKSRSPTRPL